MAVIMAAQIRLPISPIALVSAILVSISGVTGSAGAARAADCLAAPDAAAPPNSHWFYRTDRTTQRKCWYLRAVDGPPQDEAVKTTQTASAAVTYSLGDFKDFIAQRGNGNLSDRDVEQLYAEFLEWRRHPANTATNTAKERQ
jgi:hypothetical protein